MCLRFIVLLVLSFLTLPEAISQLEIRHIETGKQSNANLRVSSQKQTVLQLPFWDDFSESTGRPRADLWEDSLHVNINPTLGANPPTLNVVTFDGTDFSGVPYNANSQFVGNTDNLVSLPIDLSKIPANKLNSVFISFFWQAKGKGELPNDDDSLRLQFLNDQEEWITQFTIVGGESALRLDADGNNIFTQEILKVDGQEFFHDQFRFRFQAFGRLTGGFDTWHLDYVFLNQDRDFADLAYFDRGITHPPSSLFGIYSSMPADQYFLEPDSFIHRLEFELFNLDALPHPVEFTLNIYDLVNNVLIDRTNEPTTTPILAGLERRLIETNLPDLSSLTVTDSMVLETEFIYNTGDRNLIQFINPVSGDTTFYDNVDYKVNDTLRRRFIINNYLAYDDGIAEFAAGVNQARGQLAYRYFVPSLDTLTDIDISFPQIAPISDGLPIEITVWKRLTNEPGSILAKQPFTIELQSEPNNFTRYTLEFPLLVRDTIYIGYQQFEDNFIGIGLDKTTDTGDMIYVNVDGAWRKNVGIEGSLMLRPVFRKAETALITSIEDDLPLEFSIYPNPNSGQFRIEGSYDYLRLYDLLGKELPFEDQAGSIRLLHPKTGIAFLEVYRGTSRIVERIIFR